MSQENKEIWFLIEDYARKLKAVDNWSGKVVSNEFMAPAAEAEKRVKKALQSLIEESVAKMPSEPIWNLIEDYAVKLQSVDYWSGSVLNSKYLTPAHEARIKLRDAFNSLNKEPVVDFRDKSRFKYKL